MREHVLVAARRDHLHVARAGALEPLMDRREAALVGVGRVDLPVVLHRGGERQRLAARAGAEIDHLLAGLRAAEQGGELRALVLDLDLALEERGLGMDRRALGIRRHDDAQAGGRPARRLRVELGEFLGGLLARRLQRVDAQIERRARRERRALLGPLLAEGRGELRIEPFGIVAEHMRRGAFEARGAQPRVLLVGERRRREARAVAQLRDRVGIDDRARAPASRAAPRAACRRP